MTSHSYPEYKDSKILWVGKIPAHWRLNRTKVLFELMKRPPRDQDEIVTAFRDGEVTLRNNRRTDGFTNALQEIGYQGVRRGDLVIHAMDAFAGAIGVSDSHGKSTPVYSVCKPRVGVTNSWYYGRLLRHMALSGYINSLAKGIRERSTEFRWAEAGNVYLPTPPLEEQNTIVAFLDRETGKIDALIAEQEKLLTLLAEKRQATISRAVSRGLDPDAPMKDSGVTWLGEVPEHWRVSPLKYLVSLRSGGTPSKENLDFWDGDVPWASAKDLKSERLADTIDHITSFAVESGNATLVPPGTVLVVVRGMILARIFPVVETVVPMAINQDLKGVIPLEGLNGKFLAWLLRGSADESLRRLDEAGHGTKALRMDAWTSMQLPVPPVVEQTEIAAFLERETGKLDALKAEAESAIDLLRERRSALIAAAVTGKIDVRNAVQQELAA
ncbi:TPA: restriction endonuclease subunit S [Burkholderia cenocepacia]